MARDSAKDHPTVMEVLTAFIREHSREEWPPAEPGTEPPERTTRPDVQAAATFLGRRTVRYDSQRQPLNPKAADFTRADLARADLSGADLTGANLTHARLALVDLTLADLTSTNLSGSGLARANLTGAFWSWRAAPEGWQKDDSGRLKRSDRLSEVITHYL